MKLDEYKQFLLNFKESEKEKYGKDMNEKVYKQLFDDFISYLDENKCDYEKFYLNKVSFGIWIKKFNFILKKRNSTGMIYLMKF